jgi:hypothetical protein
VRGLSPPPRHHGDEQLSRHDLVGQRDRRQAHVSGQGAHSKPIRRARRRAATGRIASSSTT